MISLRWRHVTFSTILALFRRLHDKTYYADDIDRDVELHAESAAMHHWPARERGRRRAQRFHIRLFTAISARFDTRECLRGRFISATPIIFTKYFPQVSANRRALLDDAIAHDSLARAG